MGDVINLNKWKKQKAKAEKEKRAEQNRLRNGTSPSEQSLLKKKKEMADKRLDGHKLDQGDDG
jgi:hypothetical protein